jgi:Leucine-rich repeat (LRR) protein
MGGSIVSEEELEEIIERARIDRVKRLYLGSSKITKLPESIGDLLNLTHLNLRDNQLVDLPISICSLQNLKYLKFEQKSTC